MSIFGARRKESHEGEQQSESQEHLRQLNAKSGLRQLPFRPKLQILVAMRLRFPPLLLGLSGLVGCGGITREAKIATAIQTMMANAMTSFATIEGSTSVSYSCGTTTADGTLSYSVDSLGLTDSLKLIEYIQAHQNENISLPVTFTNCKIKACGDSIILNGSTANLVLDIKPDALVQTGGNLNPEEIPARFELNATNLPVTGLISGTISFSYIIEADYSKTSLNSVEILDTTTPNPLVDSGKSYNAADLDDLAEGC